MLVVVGHGRARASRRTVETMAGLIDGLGPDTRVVDLGSGYGGAARYLAGTYGCKVTCLNLSGTQIEDASLEALSVLANLKELRLRGCVLLEGEIAPLATCVALEVLDLSAHKTMAISGNLDALCVADTGKGLSCLRELNLTNCRLIGGEMSAAIVDFISGIRTAHGSAAARLQGCGRFQLPVDLVSLEEWEAAVCAAAAHRRRLRLLCFILKHSYLKTFRECFKVKIF